MILRWVHTHRAVTWHSLLPLSNFVRMWFTAMTSEIQVFKNQRWLFFLTFSSIPFIEVLASWHLMSVFGLQGMALYIILVTVIVLHRSARLFP